MPQAEDGRRTLSWWRVGLACGVLVLWGWSLVGCSSPTKNPPAAAGLAFPQGFWFGSAIAGFQGDMGCPTEKSETCDDKASDWYQWVTSAEIQKKGKPLHSGDPISKGPGQWELYPQDYKALKEQLSANAYRLSIEWSRIFPTSTAGISGFEALKKHANAAAVERYHKMFQMLRQMGIRPLVTLNHYALPTWIHDGVSCHQDIDKCEKRGWLTPKVLQPELLKFVAFVAKEYGAEVDEWVTLNEPFALILPGYIFQSPDRVNPPGVGFRFDDARTVLLAMIEAHAKMVDTLRAEDTEDADKDGKATYIGIAYNAVPFLPKDETNDLDKQGAENVFYIWNQVFLNAIIKGELDEKLDGNKTQRPDLARLDWLGVNFYGHVKLAGLKSSLAPQLSPLLTANVAAFEWQVIAPKSLYNLLIRLKKEYNKPIIITENGMEMRDPDKDEGMSAYMVRHLFWLQRAIQDGVDVKGYMYWSLVDNYEWNHGFNLRFGLFKVDTEDPKKPRTPRQGVATFHSIASQGLLSKALLNTHLTADEKALIPDILTDK